jgi:hypothetical protein
MTVFDDLRHQQDVEDFSALGLGITIAPSAEQKAQKRLAREQELLAALHYLSMAYGKLEGELYNLRLKGEE